jgi:hypothetical protein
MGCYNMIGVPCLTINETKQSSKSQRFLAVYVHLPASLQYNKFTLHTIHNKYTTSFIFKLLLFDSFCYI